MGKEDLGNPWSLIPFVPELGAKAQPCCPPCGSDWKWERMPCTQQGEEEIPGHMTVQMVLGFSHNRTLLFLGRDPTSPLPECKHV